MPGPPVAVAASAWQFCAVNSAGRASSRRAAPHRQGGLRVVEHAEAADGEAVGHEVEEGLTVGPLVRRHPL